MIDQLLQLEPLFRELGGVRYALMTYTIGALAAAGIPAISRNNFRVEGAPSWATLALLAPASLLAGAPLAAICGIDRVSLYSIPVCSMIFAGLWLWMIQPQLGDFQARSTGAMWFLALAMALGSLAAVQLGYYALA